MLSQGSVLPGPRVTPAPGMAGLVRVDQDYLWKSGSLSAFRRSLFSIRAEQQEGPAEHQPVGGEKKQVLSTGSACLGASRLLASVPRGWKGSLSSLALNLAWVLNLK